MNSPFESQKATSHGFDEGASGIFITPAALKLLIATKFWVFLVGTVILIFGGIFLLGSVIEPEIIGVSIISSILIAVIMVLLGVCLLKYGSAIDRLKRYATSHDFELAMLSHSRFWVLMSVLNILSLASTILTWLGMVFLQG